MASSAMLSFSSHVSTGLPRIADSGAASSSSSNTRCPAPVVRAAVGLESKSLAELRALARERGVRGDTRAELIKLLTGLPSPKSSNGSAFAPVANGATAAAAATPAPVSNVDFNALRTMPMSQLRAVARSRGATGETRDAIIKSIAKLSGVAPPPSAPQSSSSASGASSGNLTRQQLAAKSLPALRAYARSKGLAGANSWGKEQIIQALASGVGVPLVPSYTAPPTPPPPPPSATPAYTPPPPPAAAPSSFGGGMALNDLQSMSMAQLRALGKERGIRGDTRSELIRLLSASPKAAAYQTAATPTPTATSAPAFQPAPASAGVFTPSSAESTATLPPFQSQVPAGAIEPVKLASEVSALKQQMQDIQEREKQLEGEKNSLAEQATFLRNVLVGGIGLAVVPLVLPFAGISPSTFQTMGTAPTTTPTTATATGPATTPTPTPPRPAPTPPSLAQPPAPVVKELSPEDYCRTLPSNLLAPPLAKFCDALNEPDYWETDEF